MLKNKAVVMSSSMEESPLLPSTNEPNTRTRVVEELKLIWRIAIPGIILRVSQFGSILVTQSFIGHINQLLLAAFSLDQTVFFRFINAIMMGMSSATETLCGQAFGAGQHHKLGLYLQRSWIVNFLAVTICTPLYFFSGQILSAIGQDRHVADAASSVSLWFIPFSYSLVFAFSCQMFLQSQMKNHIIGWVSAPALVVNIVLSLVLVNILGFGSDGALASMVTANWLIAASELAYILIGRCPDTWKGFDKAAFSQLWPVLKLSVSSGLMMCLQIWYNTILVLVSGYLPDAKTKISAFSTCLNINNMHLMVCIGLLAAASVRVSNELGRGDVNATKFAMQVLLSIALVIGITSFVLSLTLNKKMAYVFTNEEEVVKAIDSLSIPLAFSMLLNSFQTVLNGIAVGAGIQTRVAMVNLGSFYIVGLPVGLCLSFLTALEMTGLWLGLLSAVLMQTVFVGAVVLRTDWHKMVEKSSERINQWS